ncbi:MAG: acetyl-CoA decarbonylase/synthase complex subunit delta [Deltaproteobacteria bacterium]|nr:acetyl-CoA decarbonylase/synthase complex subunit delta [Deltaproteobacteria bacterium]
MGFEIVKESYAGGIKEITIGKGDNAITLGGETCYPFYQFEGNMPNKPKIAMEVWDMEPEDWAEAALSHFKDVVSDPAAWAKKCVKEFGADAIVLQLKSIDPNDKNAGPEDAVATVKKVLKAIDVPLIIWGCTNIEKDEEVLKKISEDCEGENLIIGPVEDANHKGIGASAMGFGHTLISSSPIDVNLAKQVNILLENLGMPMDRILVDPTTGGVGYGMEYSYSVMERLRMAAMAQGDDKLQFPMINNLGNEVWKCKEAKQPVDEAPELGDPEKRPILMEAVGAVTYLMAGSDLLFMRHPESVRLVKSFIDLVMDGGSASDVAPIKKELDDVDIDFASISPKPDLTIAEEKKAAPKKAAPKKAEAPKAAPKAAAPKAAPKAAAPKEEAKPAAPAVDEAKAAEDKAKLEAGAKAKAEVEAKAKAEAEKKAEADAKAKAEAETKAKADAEAKARTEEVAKRESEEDAIRQRRAKEQEERMAKDASGKDEKVTMTAAKTQKSALSKFKNIRR